MEGPPGRAHNLLQRNSLWNSAAFSYSVLTGSAGFLLLLSACTPSSTTTSMRSPSLESPPSEASTRTVGRPEDRYFDVLTFNSALLPEIVSYTLPAVRAGAMAPFLAGYDALVLHEAFVDSWRAQLIEELADSYPYRGELVGRDGAGGFALRQDGGIIILSRWPILREATMIFGTTCTGIDCLADKGVAYVAVRKGGCTYHLFGTHAQSTYGRNADAVRLAQFELFSDFVNEQEIPTEEAVLLAGDFNVDASSPELVSMLRALGASWPPIVGSVKSTWDPEDNAWADGRRHWLDYVLIADGYGAPVASWNRAVPLQAGDLDLSDHFAVWARIAMPAGP